MNKFRVALLLLVSMLLVAGSALAQTAETGAIVGTVSQAGTPLPGVTVEVRSAALQGVRTEVSDSAGRFRFNLLPPGDYTLTATLSGFSTVTQKNIRVGLNRVVTLEVNMAPQVSEQITVTGAAPVVDVSSTVSGANVTSQTMQALPLGRNFVAAAQVAPGTAADASGTTVYGSSGAENAYIIDGLNTTEVERGRQGKRLNFDFIQEVETMTGGLPAEYGRVTGGIINAITKSGSNEFHGDLFAYDSGGSLNADNTTAVDRPRGTTTIGSVDSQYDFGANLGGYILKDRLWFFGAYDKVKETDLSTRINTPLIIPGAFELGIGQSLNSELDRDLYAGKLSFAATPNHLINLSVFGDPSEVSGAIRAISGTPSTFLGTNKVGGTDGILRYSGVFGTNWNANASVGRHKEKNETAGEGVSIPQVQFRTSVPNILTGGLGFIQNQKFSRDTYKADISAFFGSHQFKFGGDKEDLQAENTNMFSGGDRVRVQCATSIPATVDANGYRRCPAGEPFYYIHEVYVNAGKVDPLNPATFAANILPGLTSSPKTENTSAYLQDSWKVMPNLTLNLGLRWESQKVGGIDPTIEWPINLNDNWAPRVGVIFDPANNGRSKLYANYGRFYESIPMDINLRTFGGELSLQVNNASPTPGNVTPACGTGVASSQPCASLGKNAAGTERFVPSAAGSGATRTWAKFLGNTHATPVDPDLKGQYIDEYLLGYDYELAANLAVGIKGTYRNLGRVIEDMSANGEYKVANPGSGEGVTTGYLYHDGVATVPKPKRQYKGVELHAQKRFSNNYQFFASYVWSRLEGNYDGTFQASTGQLDPNINSAYDYGEFAVNNDGLLSNDRTHQFKFYGSYTLGSGFAKGLDLGLSTYWASGVPLTAYGYDTLYRNYEAYLTPRGDLGRGPSEWEADVHLGYPVPLGGSRLNLLVDVFNIFNRQAISNLDMRYNLSSDPACAGLGSAVTGEKNSAGESLGNCAGGFGGEIENVAGTVQPIGQLANARATASNPDFLKKGTGFTGVRSIRVGVRWSF